MLKDATATELADHLEAMGLHPHNTGGLSMLDEATYAFGTKSTEIADAQQAFANARHVHMGSYSSVIGGYSDETWQYAMTHARRLAALLRPLGDTRIARCKEPTGWGTCDLQVDAQGQCHSPADHTSEEIDVQH